MGNSMKKTKKLLIAGPCVIEDGINTMNLAFDLNRLAEKYNFDFVFKASFDKALSLIHI